MASIDLLNLEPQRITRSLEGKSMLIYGNPKIGKTTLASQIENVLICEFEPGASALHNVLVQPIAKWEDWKKCVRQLVKDREKLKEKISVVCLDTVDEAYKACERWICQQNGIDNLKEIPYGRRTAA